MCVLIGIPNMFYIPFWIYDEILISDIAVHKSCDMVKAQGSHLNLKLAMIYLYL